MKKKKKSLLSLNKTRIQNLQQLSRIVGGEETNTCETRVHECDNTTITDCKSSAYAPPTGRIDILENGQTQTNGLPGNDCC